MKFSKTILAAATLAGLSAAMPAQAQDDQWGSLSAYIAVTSDYRFRGISQNDKNPAPQASINWTGPAGFYVGTWVSKVNFLDNTAGKGGTSLETDFYAGKHTDLWGFGDLNVQAYYYAYPDHNRAGGAPKYSYFEGIAQVSIPVFLANVVLLNLVVDFHQPKALIGGLLVLAVAATAVIVARVRHKGDGTSRAERARKPIGAEN